MVHARVAMAVLGLAIILAAMSCEARQAPARLQATAEQDQNHSEHHHEHEHEQHRRGGEGPDGATRVRLLETASESCVDVQFSYITYQNEAGNLLLTSKFDCPARRDEGMFSVPAPAGQCDITGIRTPQPPNFAANTVINDYTNPWGTALITCTFTDAAEACTGALCSETVITAQATIHRITAQTPTPPTVDVRCSCAAGSGPDCHSPFNPAPAPVPAPGPAPAPAPEPAPAAQQSAPSTDVKAALASAPARTTHHGSHDDTKQSAQRVYFVSAWVFKGEVTSVTNAKGRTQYSGGHLELVSLIETSSSTSVPDPNLPWLERWGYTIDLLEREQSY